VASGAELAELKEGVLEKVGSTRTPQPVLAVAPFPDADRDALGRDGLVVVALAVADPGNLGTLVRSAEAAGAAAILLGPGSVDAYNPKVVRASAGAIFGIPVVDAESEGWTAVEALDALGELGRQRLGATATLGTPHTEVDFTRPTAVVLGNEAHGIDAAVDARLDGHVHVAMAGPAESLNVAMAGTVLCFESARQRAGSAT
jgi:TrmH family RNA methyltransferase